MWCPLPRPFHPKCVVAVLLRVTEVWVVTRACQRLTLCTTLCMLFFRYIIKYDKLVPGPSHFTSATFAKPDMPCTDFSDNGLMVQGAMPLHTMEGHFDQFAKLHKREYRYDGSQHSTATAVFPVCPHKRKLACACALIAVSGDDERVERQRYFQSNARFISAYNRKYVTTCFVSVQERRLAVEWSSHVLALVLLRRSRRAKSSLTLALNSFADRSPAEIKRSKHC